jgi:hypothetical protein
MGMMVVLLDASFGEPMLDEQALGALALLGITTASVLQDDETVSIVLDGWAFDPLRSADEAQTAVAGPASGARVLRQLRTAVAIESHKGGPV